jgi:hypothetical protein
VNGRPSNRAVLRVFSPLLALAGAGAFILPADKALLSAAPFYAAFHLFFGALGAWCAFGPSPRAARRFNLTFGLIDLYQALAQACAWFPAALFRWKAADLPAHVLVGAVLVGCAALGRD